VGIPVPPPVPDPHLVRADTPLAYTLYSTLSNTFHRTPPLPFPIPTPRGYIYFLKTCCERSHLRLNYDHDIESAAISLGLMTHSVGREVIRHQGRLRTEPTRMEIGYK
jgi:hypothetical protein